jgi:hypothetical protein
MYSFSQIFVADEENSDKSTRLGSLFAAGESISNCGRSRQSPESQGQASIDTLHERNRLMRIICSDVIL